MDIIGWKYYNHAAVPVTAPHEEVNIVPIRNKTIWKMDGRPIMARWTSNFDCGYETSWYYVIKDSEFDIQQLKSKRRYEIKKGEKFFDVKRVEANEYIYEIYKVRKDFFNANGIRIEDFSVFKNRTLDWGKYIIYCAFLKDTDEVCGYARIEDRESYYDFMNLTVNPKYENKAINAAIVSGILKNINDDLAKGKYICDGSKNIFHRTNFQHYLEKYFMFRKAYCKLNVEYPTYIKVTVALLKPFKKIIKSMSDNSIRMGQLTAVLEMDRISKECKSCE